MILPSLLKGLVYHCDTEGNVTPFNLPNGEKAIRVIPDLSLILGDKGRLYIFLETGTTFLSLNMISEGKLIECIDLGNLSDNRKEGISILPSVVDNTGDVYLLEAIDLSNITDEELGCDAGNVGSSGTGSSGTGKAVKAVHVKGLPLALGFCFQEQVFINRFVHYRGACVTLKSGWLGKVLRNKELTDSDFLLDYYEDVGLDLPIFSFMVDMNLTFPCYCKHCNEEVRRGKKRKDFTYTVPAFYSSWYTGRTFFFLDKETGNLTKLAHGRIEPVALINTHPDFRSTNVRYRHKKFVFYKGGFYYLTWGGVIELEHSPEITKNQVEGWSQFNRSTDAVMAMCTTPDGNELLTQILGLTR